MQNIINVDPRLEKRSGFRREGYSDDIRAIIISPTRELAEQIAVEAMKVTKNTGVIVQTAVGGSRKSEGLHRIKTQGCHILVGTPGRLNDILSDPYSNVRAPNLSALVLDEADRMLDQGFAPQIEAIQQLLPDRTKVDRQTLLYSATIPREVMHIVRATLKPNFQFVRTVKEGEQQTHEKVPQKLVNVGGYENLMPALVELCKREISSSAGPRGKTFKAMVFFGATSEVTLAAAIFENLKNPGQSHFGQHPLHPARIIEIHGKLSQGQRSHAADRFKRADSAIMLTSDVTARGMDFPNVTHVIQIGLPVSQDQYVHRIGRTARGDKTGEGWLIVPDVESSAVRQSLPEMPLQPDNSLETGRIDMKRDAQLPEHVAQTLSQVMDATKMAPAPLKEATYLATLGVSKWMPNKRALLNAMNDRARYGWGMEQLPPIRRALAAKLGLSRFTDLNIVDDRRNFSGDGVSFGNTSNRGNDFNRGGSGRSSYGGGFGRSSSGGGFGRSSSGGSFGRSSNGNDYNRGGSGRSSSGGGYGRSSYGDAGRDFAGSRRGDGRQTSSYSR